MVTNWRFRVPFTTEEDGSFEIRNVLEIRVTCF